MTEPSHWQGVLTGVDAVVNCAGILRESRSGDFKLIHETAPLACAQAAQELGIVKFVQISALGHPEDGPFITSKHAFDKKLAELSLQSVIIRPSVVVSTAGSYGGTSFLRALASFPGVLFLPGQGDQQLQPVSLEDLADITAWALSQDVAQGQVLYATGPEVLTFHEYLFSVRRWLGGREPRLFHVPMPVVRIGARLGEIFGNGPLGGTMLRMLSSGNIAPTGQYQKLVRFLGRDTVDIRRYFESSPSYVQDRWHAKFYLLRPYLFLTLIAIWLVSGVTGLGSSEEYYGSMLTSIGVPETSHGAVVLATSWLDITLGLLVLIRRLRPVVLWLMLISTLSYSMVTSMGYPEVLADPFAPIVKNLAVVGVILSLMITEKRR